MRGRGIIALIIFIIVCNGVTSDEAENDLREFLQYQARSGQPKWDSDSDSESGQELVTDSLEFKNNSEDVKNETRVDVARDSKQAENVEEVATSTMAPHDALRNRDNDDRESRKSAESLLISQTRELRPDEYIFLDEIGYYGMKCASMGQFFNYLPEPGVCLICVCLYRGNRGVLSPVCAACNGCKAESVFPETPINIYDIVKDFPSTVITQPDYVVPNNPIIAVQEASCSPLPEGVAFQHPLNPCQTCLCSRSMSIYGKVEVKITCQENRQCVLPLNPIKLPDKIYVALPQCQQFPANVIFPHPTSICKQCVCSASIEQVMCDIVPGCGPDLPYPVDDQLPTVLPAPYYPENQLPTVLPPYYPGVDVLPFDIQPPPSNEYNTDVPGINIQPTQPDIYGPSPGVEIQWPIDNGPEIIQPGLDIISGVEILPVQKSKDDLSPLHIPAENKELIARSPLPGPRPHKSCRPFMSNKPFQHPWDACQVCICTESHNIPYNDIEVNCFTKATCCYSEDGVLVAKQNIIANPKTIIGAQSTIDVMCEVEVIGQPFIHPFLPCNECMCKVFGSHVAPVCNYMNSPQCSSFIPIGGESRPHTVGETGLTYTDLQCRFHRLNEVFEYNCLSCNCFTWKEYQIRANCVLLPGCVIGQSNIIPGLLNGQINQPNIISIGNGGSPDFGIGMRPSKFKILSDGGFPVNRPLDYSLDKGTSGIEYSYGDGPNLNDGSFGFDLSSKPFGDSLYGPTSGITVGLPNPTATPDMYSSMQNFRESNNNPALLFGKAGESMRYNVGKLLDPSYQPFGDSLYGPTSGLAVGLPDPTATPDMYSSMQSFRESNNNPALLFGKAGESMRYNVGKLLDPSYQTSDLSSQGLTSNGLSVSHSSVSDTSQVPLYTQMPLSSANFYPDTSKYLFPQDLGKIKHGWQTVPLPKNGYGQQVQYPLSYRVKYPGNLASNGYSEQTDSFTDFQNELGTGFNRYDAQYPPVNYKYPPSFMQSQYHPDENKSGKPRGQGHIPLSVVKQEKIGLNEPGLLTKGKRTKLRIKSGNPEDMEISEEEGA